RWRMAEHSSLRVTDLSSSSFLLLLIMSFKYLTYLGIFSRASTKGMLTCNSLNNLRNLPCCALTLLCVSAWGYGILGLYSFISSSANSLLFFFSPSFCSGGISCTLKCVVSFSIDLIGVSSTLPRKIAFTCAFGFGSVLLGKVPWALSAI